MIKLWQTLIVSTAFLKKTKKLLIQKCKPFFIFFDFQRQKTAIEFQTWSGGNWLSCVIATYF